MLKAWILDMEKHGLPLQLSVVRYLAQLLVSARIPSATIGKNWVNCYCQRGWEETTGSSQQVDMKKRTDENVVERLEITPIVVAHARLLLSSADYLKNICDTKPHGTLFKDESEMVSGVDTGFFVDHDEPNAALEAIKNDLPWPLGDLAEGHEFLLIIQHRCCSSCLLQTQAV